MQFERVLITGAGGMLGKAVYNTFSVNYPKILATDIDLNEPWLEELDVRKISDCEKVFQFFNPDLVINLAALTDLEYCEHYPKDCWQTNTLGVENISLLCDKYNSTLVHISTAGIFDGKKDIYHDYDIPNPLSEYGKSKYVSEQIIEKRLKKHYIFRAGWMMGGGIQKDKKFVNKIYKQISKGAKKLFVVDDKLGTPTYTIDFANSIHHVINTDYFGLYNQVCEGEASRYDIALKFIEFLGLKHDVVVEKVDSDYFTEEYFAPRPYSEQMVNMKLNSRGINKMRNWEECLKEYSQEFINDLAKQSI